MGMIDHVIQQVRHRETPFYDHVHRVVKRVMSVHVPVIPGLHHALYYERRCRHTLWQNFCRLLYYEPMFRTRCEEVGSNLRLIDGIPLLLGNPIRIRIGHDVTISGVTTFLGSKLVRAPVLEIGSGSYIGYQTSIVSGKGVYIGRHVLISNRVTIAADDSHPLDPARRVRNLPPDLDAVKEVWIDDGAWIGEHAAVLKGIRVGQGAVVGAHAVVTKDVPAFTVVAGNPARVVKRLPVCAGAWDKRLNEDYDPD